MTGVNSEVPDPEVPIYPTQKRYPNSYKLRILAETDAPTAPGEVAALLRREGIYASTLSDFRNQRNMGKLSSAGTKVAKTAPRDETQLRKSAKLERDNRKLVRDLAQSATG
jgi:transposase-like protein